MRKDIPSLGVLQAFEASARLQSFSRAAEELALTPSAVSHHVAALEDRLGVTLFVRARQRLALTDTGRSYAARIRLHLEQIERDTQEIRVGRDEGYVLHLAVVSTFCTQWLIPRLPQFAALHPRITLNLSVRSEVFAFDESGFDAAIYYGDRLWPDTQGCMVVPEGPCVPVCSPQYAAAHALHDEAAWLHCPHLTLASRAHAWRDWYAERGWHYTLHAPRADRATSCSPWSSPQRLRAWVWAWCRCCSRKKPWHWGRWCRRTRRSCLARRATGSCGPCIGRGRRRCRFFATGSWFRPARVRPEPPSSSPYPRSGWAWG